MVMEALVSRARKIIDTSYEMIGHFPYELYTLMCGVADEYGINYTMELHGEVLNKV
jgi:hypothetical protein